jgi:hypothetical protein
MGKAAYQHQSDTRLSRLWAKGDLNPHVPKDTGT